MAQDPRSQSTAVPDLQRALRHVEEQLRSLILHNADGILIIDAHGLVRFANPAAAALLLCPSDELLGQPFGYPIVLDEATEIDVLRSGAQPGSAEMRVMETIWEGELAFVASLRDTTERQLAAAQIKRLSRANAVLAEINAAVARERTRAALFDEVCRIAVEVGEYPLAWIGAVNEDNESLRPVVARGTDQQDLDQLSLWTDEQWGRLPEISAAVHSQRLVVSPASTAEYAAGYASFAAWAAVPLLIQGRVLSVLLVHVTRREFLDQTEQNLLEQVGLNVSYALENIERETTRQQMQAALQAGHERYRTLVSNAPIAIYRTTPGPQGHFLMVNPTLCAMLDYTEQELLLLTAAEMYQDPRERMVFSEAVLHAGHVTNMELRLRRKDGALFWGSVSARVVAEDDGNVAYFDCIMEDITARKQTEQQLHEASQHLQAIIQASPLAIIELDIQGRVKFWNPAAERLFGWQAAEVLGQLNPIVPPEKLSEFLDEHQKVMRGELDLPTEVRRTRRDGQSIDLLVSRAPLFDEHGVPVAGVAIFADITARKQTEIAEREQRALAEALHSTAKALSSTLNLEEVLDRVLEYVGRIVPYDNASILLIDDGLARCVRLRGHLSHMAAESIHLMHLPVDQTEDLRYVAQTGEALIIADVHEYAAWSRLPGLEWIHAHLSAPLTIRGKVVGFLNLDSAQIDFFTPNHAEQLRTFADQVAVALENAQLYDRVQRYAEELETRVADRTAELDRERQRLRAILDTAGEGILFTDRAGKIEYLNPAMEQLTGYASAEVMGMSPGLWRSGRTPGPVYTELWRAILHGEVWHGEVVNRRKDGTLYDAALIVAPLVVGDSISGFVAITRDITRQKELDRLKDQFVANVSHELRTPLTNIKLYAGLLQLAGSDKQPHYLQTLQREVKRLEGLIENLLSIARLDMGQPVVEFEAIDVNDLARQLLYDRARLINERGLTARAALAVDVPSAWANLNFVAQILANLVTNATQYTPPGGHINISTARQVQQNQLWITLTVQDTGPGINDADLPRLFDRFYRGEVGRRSGTAGTGLGLAICRDLAEKMGGRITVASDSGRGAAFTVWLKPAEEQA